MDSRARPRRESHALLSCGGWVAEVLAWDPQLLLQSSSDPGCLLTDPPPKLPDAYADPAEYLRLLSRYRLLEMAASLASDAREAAPAASWQGVVRAQEVSGDGVTGAASTVDLLVRLDPPPPRGAIGAEDALLCRCAAEAWDEEADGRAEWLALALADASGEVWVRVSVPRCSAGGGSVGARLVLRRLGTMLPALRMQAALRAHSAAPRWMLGCRLRQDEVQLSSFERAMAQSKARSMGLLPKPSPNRAERATGAVAGAARPASGSQLPEGLHRALAARLNPVQTEAVCGTGAAGSGFRLLQGPPGTGKTRVVVALLSALFATRKRAAKLSMPGSRPTGDAGSAGSADGAARRLPRLLVAAPSNCATDEVVSRVVQAGLEAADGARWRPTVVRIGPREAIRCPPLPDAYGACRSMLYSCAVCLPHSGVSGSTHDRLLRTPSAPRSAKMLPRAGDRGRSEPASLLLALYSPSLSFPPA
jgi:hypothetical protein